MNSNLLSAFPNNKDWLFEHEHEEATPMDVGSGPNSPAAEAPTPVLTSAPSLGDETTVLPVKWGEPSVDAAAGEFASLLSPGEKLLFSGPTWKRKGLFSKNRVLLFTDKPRLLYVDPLAGNELKGEIPWTREQPVTVVVIDATHFDMVSPADSGRAYHFVSTDPACNSDKWADVVNDFKNRGRPAIPKPRSAMALFGAVTDE